MLRCPAGVNDKSQLQRQVEKYADLYTLLVSNFSRYTPYYYFRSQGQSLTRYRRDQDPFTMGSKSPAAWHPAEDVLAS
jgi:hypothetical protein